MRTLISRIPAQIVVLITVAAVAAGCGGSDDGGGTVDVAKGRKLFQESCRSCHALADAKANGVFGPDLDSLQPDSERVLSQIEIGGGGMPPKLLEGEDAQTVADYVGKVAGNPGADAKSESSTRGNTKSSEGEAEDSSDDA